ncbi:MAG: hypothetical protein WA947_22210 [Phormidesmis sp.]
MQSDERLAKESWGILARDLEIEGDRTENVEEYERICCLVASDN